MNIRKGQFGTAQSATFHPVILGSDIGTYALARCYNEGFGVRSTAVARAAFGYSRNSRILDIELINPETGELLNQQIPSESRSAHLADDSLESIVAGLLNIAPVLQKRYPGKKLLLNANSDYFVNAVVKHKDQLSKYYLFAMPSMELLDTASSKSKFPELAEKCGMRAPKTILIDFGKGLQAVKDQLHREATFPFGWVMKPDTYTEYDSLRWDGKRKVYMIKDSEELDATLEMLAVQTEGHPIAQRFVVQPRIEGNDTHNLSITAYRDSSGKITMLGSAQVLLEDHNPALIGNPVAMVVEQYPELYKQVEGFLHGANWHGFANFDVKIDKHTGIPYVLEVNPRIGRNCFYNTVGGINPMYSYVKDLVDGESTPCRYLSQKGLYTTVPRALAYKYIDAAMRKKVARLKYVNVLYNLREVDFSLRALKRIVFVCGTMYRTWGRYNQSYPIEAFKAQGEASFNTENLQY